jgi:phosphoglycolate phosphatase
MRDLTLVFDLDGTLVDTAPDLIAATNAVIATLGLAPVADTELRPWISYGARRLIEVALDRRASARSAADVDRLLEHFLAHYEAYIAVGSRAFAGLDAVLDHADAVGVRLAVCTNKREGLSRKLLGELGLAHRFGAIAGRDTFPVCKPDPRHLTGAIALAGGTPSAAVMVGDSDVDVATAKAAGIPVIAVTFGYTTIPVETLAADALIDHYDDFWPALRRLRG